MKTLLWMAIVALVAVLAARYLRIPCGLGRNAAGISGSVGGAGIRQNNAGVSREVVDTPAEYALMQREVGGVNAPLGWIRLG